MAIICFKFLSYSLEFRDKKKEGSRLPRNLIIWIHYFTGINLSTMPGVSVTT